MQGNWQRAGPIASCLPTMAWREFAERLALSWPSRSEIAITAILLVTESVVTSAVGAAKL